MGEGRRKSPSSILLLLLHGPHGADVGVGVLARLVLAPWFLHGLGSRISSGYDGELMGLARAVVRWLQQLNQDSLLLSQLALLTHVAWCLKGYGILLVDFLSIEIPPSLPVCVWVVKANLYIIPSNALTQNNDLLTTLFWAKCVRNIHDLKVRFKMAPLHLFIYLQCFLCLCIINWL